MDPTGHVERDSIQFAVGLGFQGAANTVKNGKNRSFVTTRAGEVEDTNEEIQTSNLVIRIYLARLVLKRNADEGGIGGDYAADALRYLLATKVWAASFTRLRGL